MESNDNCAIILPLIRGWNDELQTLPASKESQYEHSRVKMRSDNSILDLGAVSTVSNAISDIVETVKKVSKLAHLVSKFQVFSSICDLIFPYIAIAVP